MENTEKRGNMISLLNLPESTLDCILKRLTPIELIKMSEVCTCLRDVCRSDHLWENYIKQKWGRIIGDAAYKEWQCHITTIKSEETLLNQHINQNGSLGSFCGAWPVLSLGSYLEDCKHLQSFLSNNSMMALYLSLESGKFWFPAQVYRGTLVRDALFSYDSKNDTFKARQRSGGWQLMGHGISWENLRASPVETPPCVRHVSDCLEDLKPGDHIEIQWKLRSETHYDWWYAVIGHLDSCNKNENYCLCCNSETLVVEFRQYPHGASMRQAKLPRHNNGEQGGNQIGFYGGIRKLHSEEEIEKWKVLLPYDRRYM